MYEEKNTGMNIKIYLGIMDDPFWEGRGHIGK